MRYKEELVSAAIERYDFGFTSECDADTKVVLYGAICNHCDEYFTSSVIGVYCDKCKTEQQPWWAESYCKRRKVEREKVY